jgi:hypothetical protein
MKLCYSGQDPHLYIKYYQDQVGSGLPYYSGTVYQRGNGFGAVFSSLIRGISPLIRKVPSLLKSGAKIVGKQAVRSGVDLLRDPASGENVKVAGKKRLREAGANILEEASKRLRQSGQGVKRTSSSKRKLSLPGSGVSKKRRRRNQSANSRKQTIKRTKQDIFK